MLATCRCWQFTHKDHMTFDFNGASLFARFAGREVFITRPAGQSLRLTAKERSGAALEVWALGFYGCLSVLGTR
jgi:hypothetical protein